MTERSLPERIENRADIDRLLAATTNYEERMPKSGDRRAFDLRRQQSLLQQVGHPHRGIRTSHIAGSKGKGSVARMLAHGLREGAGAKVGLFTSPHLEDLSERIEIDGRPIGEADFAAAASQALPAIHAAQGTEMAPTFYEIMTTIAWLAFRAARCGDVVLETGLGGRLDATNVCEPALTVITPIELEHAHILGDTVTAIAGEKAGIVKPGVPVVTSAREPALGVIRARAQALDAPCYVLGEDFVVDLVATREGPQMDAVFSTDAHQLEFSLPVAGRHQAENAAVVIRGMLLLGVAPRAACDALRTVRLPGAMEVVSRNPTIVVDGAHTPNSAQAAADTMGLWWPNAKPVLILAIMEGKALDGVLDALLPCAAQVITTQVESRRAMAAEDLAAHVRKRTQVDVQAFPDRGEALAAARKAAGADGMILVSGSVYLAGAIRGLVMRRKTA